MILCDAIFHSKPSQDVLNIAWLVLHVFGILANFYAHCKLKKRWNFLGNFSISLQISILSNILALFCHAYLPVNNLIRNFTGLQWSLGSFCCTVLPRFANFVVAVSTLALMVVIVQKYYKISNRKDITLCETESTMAIMLATATLILAPEFCQCGGAVQAHILADKGICVSPWQATYQGHLYEALKLLLQYIIPVAFIMNSFFKIQLTILSAKNRCLRHFLRLIIDCMTGVSIALFVYYFPVKTMMLGAKEFVDKHDAHAFPDTASAIEVMDYVAVCCCIAAPFEIIEMIKDEDKEIPDKTNANEETSTAEIFLTGEFQEKPKGETVSQKEAEQKVEEGSQPEERSIYDFLISLINDEPLKLRNEIIV